MLALPVVHQSLVHHGNSTIPQEPLNRPAINLYSAIQCATPSPCAEPLLAESHALAKKKTGSDAHRNELVQPGHARSDSAVSTKGTHRLAAVRSLELISASAASPRPQVSLRTLADRFAAFGHFTGSTLGMHFP